MYLFAPLDRHYDKGFGAVADSFYEAGTELKEQYSRSKLNGHLPICYLFRHAIELFLKGAIIIFHQRLRTPYGSEPYTSEPKIPVDGKLKSIYAIHDIELLYKYLAKFISEREFDLNEVTTTNWDFPADLGSKFKKLKEIDSSSAYFRYPTEKSSAFEKDKSAFKETSLEDVMALAKQNKEPMKAMKVMTVIGRDTQIFVHDDSFTEDAMNLLSDVVEIISTYHFALMHELGGGGLS